MKNLKLSGGEKRLLSFAGLLVLLTLVFFSVSGMKFLGYLTIEGAGLCVLWAILCRWAEKSLLARRCKALFVVCISVIFLVVAVSESIIISHGEREDPEIHADAVIVLGAGIKDAEPSPALQTRLDAARSYMERHPEIPVVLSGGLGLGETVTEAEVMWNALATGEESWDSRLLKEPKATSTAENFRYACEILRENGVDPETSTIAFVTNDFHIYRAELIAQRMGVDAFGVPAELPWWWVNLACYVRESFALVKTLIFD
jgi:uncharacterized SAM-binding protein YcdF (DUF218 family)